MSNSISTAPAWDMRELVDTPGEYSHKMYRIDKLRSLATGAAITALCGFVGTVSTNQQPKPLCPRCQVKASFLTAGEGK